jgi:hypothetical protein
MHAAETELVEAIGADPRADPHLLPRLLNDYIDEGDRDGVDLTRTLLARFGQGGPAIVPQLCRLLLVDWHHDHENIASSLQDYADPGSVPALRQGAEIQLEYRTWDDGRPLHRKCMWALSDIRTPEAVTALEELTRSRIEHVRELAEYHLAKVRNNQAPASHVGRRRWEAQQPQPAEG